MGLFDLPEKLINEHGSAVILKERIALAEDKYSALERENAALKVRLNEVSGERAQFEMQTYKLKEQVATLEGLIADKKGARYDEVRERILQFLCSRDDDDRPYTSPQIANSLSITPALCAFHLGELEEHELIGGTLSLEGPRRWYISQNGRRYLAAHGLLS